MRSLIGAVNEITLATSPSIRPFIKHEVNELFLLSITSSSCSVDKGNPLAPKRRLSLSPPIIFRYSIMSLASSFLALSIINSVPFFKITLYIYETPKKLSY